MVERILVPLDGSELAETALPAASYAAKLTGAKVLALRVIDADRIVRYVGPGGLALGDEALDELLAEERNDANAYLRTIAARLEESGVTIETAVREGRAAREIVDSAKGDDLIVMASHGRGGVTRWLLGSVAEDVLRHAPAPVLLIKASEDEVP